MKIINNSSPDTRVITYFGAPFLVIKVCKWVATDEDGAISAHETKPERDLDGCFWKSSEGFPDQYLGCADLQNTDWKDTLVKV